MNIENLKVQYSIPVSEFDRLRIKTLIERATTLSHIKLRKIYRDGKTYVTSEIGGRLGLNVALRDLRKYLERHEVFIEVRGVNATPRGAVWTIDITRI